MGNTGSNSASRRRRRSDPPPPPPAEISGDRYVHAAATQYPSQYPNPPPPPPPPYYHQYPGYYPPPPPQVPGTYGQPYGNWVGGHYPYGALPIPTPYVEHQKTLTIRNDINIKKETLRIEPDEDDPGKFLAAFTFDATVPGRNGEHAKLKKTVYFATVMAQCLTASLSCNSITMIFFAKETDNCNLAATKESVCKPITISFEQGLGQKFRQPTGTGVDSSLFDDTDWRKEGEIEVYPLVVKAEACPLTSSHEPERNPGMNSQVTQAVIEKERGEFKARVVKQILWVNGMRYELQEIYGIGNAVEGEVDGNDSAKECVICLSEPRDTTVLPCRHMCMCSGCAKVLIFQTNRCPICRQPVERLLEIKVNDGGEGSDQSPSRETTPTNL